MEAKEAAAPSPPFDQGMKDVKSGHEYETRAEGSAEGREGEGSESDNSDDETMGIKPPPPPPGDDEPVCIPVLVMAGAGPRSASPAGACPPPYLTQVFVFFIFWCVSIYVYLCFWHAGCSAALALSLQPPAKVQLDCPAQQLHVLGALLSRLFSHRVPAAHAWRSIFSQRRSRQ